MPAGIYSFGWRLDDLERGGLERLPEKNKERDLPIV